MFIFKRLTGGSLFVFLLAGTALAQENRAPVDTPRELVPVAAAPLVTATATARRVRFVSPGSVVQLRLEVFNEAGQKLFDTELHGGNVLDWHLQDGAGERVSSGSYACVLTIKSLSGRLSQRVGLVTVNDKKAAVEAAGAGELSMAQQQTIGPVEGNAAFTIRQPSEAEAITAVTHDGTEGGVTSTRGALTFRTGDLFSGKDKEQMRLTEDGRLGIGTDKPAATLDVAGTIRAERVLIAKPTKPGGDNTTTAADTAQAPDPEQPLATGSGTQNQIAKWTDNAGALGNSVITETAGGNVGVGNTNPQSLLQVGPNPGYGTTTGLLITNNLLGTQYDRGFQLAPRQTASPLTNSILIYALPTVSPAVTVPSQYGIFVDGRQGTGSISSYAALATGQNPSLGATNNTHLLMGSLAIPPGNFGVYDNTNFKSYFRGNVGIGTSNPGSKLDVVGNINTSTQYNIGGLRVLSVSGLTALPPSNTFVGVGAGTNTTPGSPDPTFSGIDNSFFGSSAGTNNSTGSYNSFFGTDTGRQNSIGGANSFFGLGAGYQNMGGGDNSFFGMSAGQGNSGGSWNAFFGREAGSANIGGHRNTIIGTHANLGGPNLTNATALGHRAYVTESNSLILGSINTVNDATADTNVGIGTTAPKSRLQVTNGDIFVNTIGTGLILKSPGGNCFRITVNDGGLLEMGGMVCPDN